MEDPRQDKVGEQGGEVEVEVGPGEDRSLGAERVYTIGGERWGPGTWGWETALKPAWCW